MLRAQGAERGENRGEKREERLRRAQGTALTLSGEILKVESS
jgi:hypothetical protein